LARACGWSGRFSPAHLVDFLTQQPRFADFALLGLLALLWGSSYLFIKIAVTDIPPITLIAIRVSIAAILLIGVMRALGERLPKTQDRGIWKRLCVQAFYSSIGAWTLLAWGQQHVDSSLASVLNSTAPIFVVLFTLSVGRMPMRKVIGATLGMLGVCFIIGKAAFAGLSGPILGQLAVLGGAVLYACAALHAKQLSALRPVTIASATMLLASIVLVPMSLMLEAPWELRPSPKALGAACVLGVFCTGLALLIYFRLVKTLGPLGVASQAYLRACVGFGLGVLLLGETVNLSVGLGLLAALVGVVAINMPAQTKVTRAGFG